MSGAILELVSNTGPQNIWITENPEITFFKTVYRRHTPFSIDTAFVNLKNGLDFGSNTSAILPHQGDLVHHVFLVFTLPKLAAVFLHPKTDDIQKMLQEAKISNPLIKEQLCDYQELDCLRLMQYLTVKISELELKKKGYQTLLNDIPDDETSFLTSFFAIEKDLYPIFLFIQYLSVNNLINLEDYQFGKPTFHHLPFCEESIEQGIFQGIFHVYRSLATTIPLIHLKLIECDQKFDIYQYENVGLRKSYPNILDPNFVARIQDQFMGKELSDVFPKDTFLPVFPNAYTSFVQKEFHLYMKRISLKFDIVFEKYKSLFGCTKQLYFDFQFMEYIYSYFLPQKKYGNHNQLNNVFNLNIWYFYFFKYLDRIDEDAFGKYANDKIIPLTPNSLLYLKGLLKLLKMNLDFYMHEISYLLNDLYSYTPSDQVDDSLKNYVPPSFFLQNNYLVLTFILHRSHIPSLKEMFDFIEFFIDHIDIKRINNYLHLQLLLPHQEKEIKGLVNSLYQGIYQYFLGFYDQYQFEETLSASIDQKILPYLEGLFQDKKIENQVSLKLTVQQMEFYFVMETLLTREFNYFYHQITYNDEYIQLTCPNAVPLLKKINKYFCQDHLYYETKSLDRYQGKPYLQTSYHSRFYGIVPNIWNKSIPGPKPIPVGEPYGVNPFFFDHNQIKIYQTMALTLPQKMEIFPLAIQSSILNYYAFKHEIFWGNSKLCSQGEKYCHKLRNLVTSQQFMEDNFMSMGCLKYIKYLEKNYLEQVDYYHEHEKEIKNILLLNQKNLTLHTREEILQMIDEEKSELVDYIYQQFDQKTNSFLSIKELLLEINTKFEMIKAIYHSSNGDYSLLPEAYRPFLLCLPSLKNIHFINPFTLELDWSNYVGMQNLNQLINIIINHPFQEPLKESLDKGRMDQVQTILTNHLNNLERDLDELMEIQEEIVVISCRNKKASCAWVRKLAHYLIKEVSFYANDQLMDTQYSDWFEAHHEITKEIGKENGYLKMIGNREDLIVFDDQVKNAYTIYFPLIFYFNNHVSYSLPMISSLNVVYQLTFKLRSFEEVVYKEKYSSFINPDDPVLCNPECFRPHLQNAHLMVEYIYLSGDERKRMATGYLEYLIDETQIDSGGDITDSLLVPIDKKENIIVNNTFFQRQYRNKHGIDLSYFQSSSQEKIGTKLLEYTYHFSLPTKLIVVMFRPDAHVQPALRKEYEINHNSYFYGERQWDNYNLYSYYDLTKVYQYKHQKYQELQQKIFHHLNWKKFIDVSQFSSYQHFFKNWEEYLGQLQEKNVGDYYENVIQLCEILRYMDPNHSHIIRYVHQLSQKIPFYDVSFFQTFHYLRYVYSLVGNDPDLIQFLNSYSYQIPPKISNVKFLHFKKIIYAIMFQTKIYLEFREIDFLVTKMNQMFNDYFNRYEMEPINYQELLVPNPVVNPLLWGYLILNSYHMQPYNSTSVFWTAAQPYQRQLSTPINSINVYCWSLHPLIVQPNGTINLSNTMMMANYYLHPLIGTNYPVNMVTFSWCMNLVRYLSGLTGKAWSR
jgi:hypothetical protein